MPTIDSDAHVVESARTWDFMDPSDAKYRPRLVAPDGVEGTQYWMVGDKIKGIARQVMTSEKFAQLTRVGGRVMDSPEEARAMENVDVRLDHMDELGIDVQVLYPTFFIQHITDDPKAEVAICRGWNRWLGDIWGQSNGRLPWTAVLPMLDMPNALEELRWARQHGAVGVFLRVIEGSRLLHDPYFYPVYDEAVRLNMAACVHVGAANPGYTDLLGQNHFGGGFWPFRLGIIGSFHSLMCSELTREFPTLRWGFIEASAEWVPYTLKHLVRRFAQRGEELPEHPLKKWNTYVTVQADDNVPYILDYAGDDNFVVGTDYGHTDPSVELNVFKILRERTGISESQYRKITETNAQALYGL